MCSDWITRLLGRGLALRLKLLDGPQPGLDLVADVLGHEHHLVQHLLLVMKARKCRLELRVEPLELVEQPGALALLRRLLPGGKLGVGLLVQGADPFDQPAQVLEVARAAFDQLVNDDTVEALLGRHGKQLLRQRQVLFGGEAKSVDDLPRLGFGGFDALADLHLLLARQQRHLAHLPQVHPHRVIQNIIAAPFLFFARLGRPPPLHLGGVNDINLQGAQLGEDLVQVGRADNIIGQGVVEIVVGQMALLLGKAQEVFDLCGEVQTPFRW